MRVDDIYVRKSTYGGVHIVTTSSTYMPIGTRLVVEVEGLEDTCYFYVKKVKIKEDENSVRLRTIDKTLEYQLVDKGESAIFRNNIDIRRVLNCSICVAPVSSYVDSSEYDYEKEEMRES